MWKNDEEIEESVIKMMNIDMMMAFSLFDDQKWFYGMWELSDLSDPDVAELFFDSGWVAGRNNKEVFAVFHDNTLLLFEGPKNALKKRLKDVMHSFEDEKF